MRARMEVSLTVDLNTTPREYLALKAGWGDRLNFAPKWRGEHADEETPVVCEVSGDEAEIKSMLGAVRVLAPEPMLRRAR